MDRKRFKKQVAFILEADKEKNILRQTHLSAKYIKNHQLSQIIELKLSEKGFYTPFPTSY